MLGGDCLFPPSSGSGLMVFWCHFGPSKRITKPKCSDFFFTLCSLQTHSDLYVMWFSPLYSCRVTRGIIVHIVQKATVTNIIYNAICWFIVQSNRITANSVISVQLGLTVLSDIFWTIIMGQRGYPLLCNEIFWQKK